MIYLATSLFTRAEQSFGYQLTRSLEMCGTTVYYPWRDAGDAELRERWPEDWQRINTRICESNLRAISQADAIVAVLEGADVDSGVAMEVGYASALGKSIWGIRTDFRTQGQSVGPVNIMLSHACQAVCPDAPSLLAALAAAGLVKGQSEMAVPAFYDEIATEYSNRALHPTTAACKTAEERSVRDLLGEHSAQRILDFGCGDGDFLMNIHADQKVGVDVSPAMLARHRARLPSATYLLGDETALGVLNAPFDIIHCSFVLDHIPEKTSLYRNVARLASPETAVIVSVFEEESLKELRARANTLAYSTAAGATLLVGSRLESITDLESSFKPFFELAKRCVRRLDASGVSIVTWLLHVK